MLISVHVLNFLGRYTSLGSTYNTFPNPALLVPSYPRHFSDRPDSLPSVLAVPNTSDVPPLPLPATPRNGISSFTPAPVHHQYYRPAYELLDESLERLGRGRGLGITNVH
jgi:FAD synthetase